MLNERFAHVAFLLCHPLTFFGKFSLQRPVEMLSAAVTMSLGTLFLFGS